MIAAATQVPHEYGPSTVGHGEAQCLWCKGTNRENAVIAPNHCADRARLDPAYEGLQRPQDQLLAELPPEFDEAGKNAMRAKAASKPGQLHCFGQMSDEWIANRVRMLLRSDLWHEAICTAGRDRIMKLSLEVEQLRAEVREWLCEKCNTVYPGPPQPGFACVPCPRCGGATAPRRTIELNRLHHQLLQHAETCGESAYPAEIRLKQPAAPDKRFEAYVAHVVGEAAQWKTGSGTHPPALKKAIDELYEYYYRGRFSPAMEVNPMDGSQRLPPWKQGPLADWSIVGMNHYHINGERRLFVAMTKGSACIKEEGKDDEHLWRRLCNQAWRIAENGN